jgi:hypothetical protein
MKGGVAVERLTLAEIEAMTTDVLTPAQVAGVLHLDQDTIRLQARSCPALLGFPVIVAGNRTKIPRVPFLRFMRGE